jgi:uncharacterized lipoprotein
MRFRDVTRMSWPLVIGLVLLALSLNLSGCAAALLAGAAGGAAVGTAAYVEGEHSQVYNANPDRTWVATLAALKEMNIRVDNSNKDALGGNIEAKRADGTDVKIKEEPVEGGKTQVKVRLGTFGDQAGSEAIQRRIATKLRA